MSLHADAFRGKAVVVTAAAGTGRGITAEAAARHPPRQRHRAAASSDESATLSQTEDASHRVKLDKIPAGGAATFGCKFIQAAALPPLVEFDYGTLVAAVGDGILGSTALV